MPPPFRPAHELVFVPWKAHWLGIPTRGGPVDRVDRREAGRSPSTVAYWVNKYGLTVAARKAPARGGHDRERLEALVAEGARSARWRERSASATPRCGTGSRATRSPRRRARDSRRDAARAGDGTLQASARSTLDDLRPRRAAGGSAAGGATRTRCHRRRRMKEILVARPAAAACSAGYDRYVGGAPLPPRRSDAQVVRRQRHGSDPIAGRRARRGAEVRAPVRELPRQGRGRAPSCCPADTSGQYIRSASRFGGSSIGRAFGCLTEGLWVRVPPPELSRPAFPSRVTEVGLAFSCRAQSS